MESQNTNTHARTHTRAHTHVHTHASHSYVLSAGPIQNPCNKDLFFHIFRESLSFSLLKTRVAACRFDGSSLSSRIIKKGHKKERC